MIALTLIANRTMVQICKAFRFAISVFHLFDFPVPFEM